MKKRRTVVVAFLLCAIMVIGVGYAAITGELTITGNASSGVQAFNVKFMKATLNNVTDSAADGVVPKVTAEGNELTTSAPATFGTDGAGLTATSVTISGLATTSDSVTITYEIKNFNAVSMELTPTISTTTKFNVTGGFADGDDEGTELDASKVVEAGGTTTYTITVSLKSNSDESVTEAFTITIDGTSDVG